MIPLTPTSASFLRPGSLPRRRQCISLRPILPSPTVNSVPSTSHPRFREPRFPTLYSNAECRKLKRRALGGSALGLSEEEEKKDGEEEEFQVLTAVRSNYNDIVIVDTPTSRMLLLDSTHNVHSMCNKGQKWTDSYWDEFSSLPPIVPQGPIAILGLGGGTAAHLMLDLWPSLVLEGWEIDEVLIDKARGYFGLSDLEKQTPAGGILRVQIGDALSPSVTVSGGYAGIVVDLFSRGKVLPQLQEVGTWLELSDKLMPNGRIMVNCAAANEVPEENRSEVSSVGDTWRQNSTIKALCEAFHGQVNWKKMPKEQGENYLALTGPLPDLPTWSALLPERLRLGVEQWRPCSPQ